MTSTTKEALLRIQEKTRNRRNPASEDIYDISLNDDNLAALDQSPSSSRAVTPNYTAAQGFQEPWELFDETYFDQFINADAWEAPVVEIEDNTKDADIHTVNNSTTVLNGLNFSQSLDVINAGDLPLDLTGVSASSFSVEETSSNSGEALGNFEWAACDPNRTDLTSDGQHPENDQLQPEEQQPENKDTAIGSHGTSDVEESIDTLGTGET
jgi:hypothetical protein